MYSLTTDLMHIPDFEIQGELGHGGMSTVYLADQHSRKRQVALKIMNPVLTSDRSFTRRFLKEGAIAAKLAHPRIVRVHHYGVHETNYYLCMEYLSGGTLKERIRYGLSISQSLSIIRAVSEGLEHAHSQGLVHRDIKPQNILFRDDDEPVLTDFGIAKTLESSTAITKSGTFLGSPQYMSPEQAKGMSVDTRSDLYSLGILFFEMLVGHLPFRADDNIALAIKHITESPPPLPLPLHPFQTVLERLLAKQPRERFQNVRQFLSALRDAEHQYFASFHNGADPTVPMPVVTDTLVNAATLPTMRAVSVITTRNTATTQAVPVIKPQTRTSPLPNSPTLATGLQHSMTRAGNRTTNYVLALLRSLLALLVGLLTVSLGTLVVGAVLAGINSVVGNELRQSLLDISSGFQDLAPYYLLRWAFPGTLAITGLAMVIAAFSTVRIQPLWTTLSHWQRELTYSGAPIGDALGDTIVDGIRWLLIGTGFGLVGGGFGSLLGWPLTLGNGALIGTLITVFLMVSCWAWQFGHTAGRVLGAHIRAHLQIIF